MIEFNRKGYKVEKLDFERKMLIASVNANKKNAIHSLTETDVSLPRQQIREHFRRSGEKISFTAYLVKSLAEILKEFPEFNSFISWGRFVMLKEITISVLVEKEYGGKRIPEPLAIRDAGNQSLYQIHQEIRKAQVMSEGKMGQLNKATWIRYIPSFLLKTFVRLADQHIGMAKKYGKVAVSAVGMYSKSATWFIPHGTATVLLTVGSLHKMDNSTSGDNTSEESLCMTASFDHEVIDGAPAARFIKYFSDILSEGKLWSELEGQHD